MPAPTGFAGSSTSRWSTLTLCRCFFCSNEIEVGGSRDRVAASNVSGLPYELILETGVTGPVFTAQLSAPLGCLRVPVESLPLAGVPVRSRQDGRWRWKERELDDLYRLAGDCLNQLLE